MPVIPEINLLVYVLYHKIPSIDSPTLAIPSFIFDVLISSLQEDSIPISCIIISGKNCSFYTICGTHITNHKTLHVDLPNKHNKGGQSSLRFDRLRVEAHSNYITQVIDNIKFIYPDTKQSMIISGSGSLKNDLHARINNTYNILRVIDLQYDKQAGLHELLPQCHDLVSSLTIQKEKSYLNLFFNSLLDEQPLSIYGRHNINYCLQQNLLKYLIIHESADQEFLAEYDTLPEIITISNFLPEAQQLLRGFGGIVGISHYHVVLPDDDEEE